MNKKLKLIIGLLIIGATTLYAADGLIGTEQDPLVTKSYVDQKISQLTGGTSNTVLANQLKEQEQLILALRDEIANLQQSGNNTYEIVVVPEGKVIYGKQGSEMIIRAGEGQIVASSVGGVQDVTDGKDLSGDTVAPKNNLLLIPREDGRGLMATKQLTVMVRGGYILN